MPFESLPQSTANVAIDALTRKIDARHAADWAVDLMALGHLDDDTVELAGLDETEWQRANSLLPKVAKRVGLDLEDRELLFRWTERQLLVDYLSGVLSEMDLIDCGYAVWARLIAADSDLPNPFHIYDQLGDEIAIETGGRDIDSLAAPNKRAWLLERLAADGAFARTGLTTP